MCLTLIKKVEEIFWPNSKCKLESTFFSKMVSPKVRKLAFRLMRISPRSSRIESSNLVSENAMSKIAKNSVIFNSGMMYDLRKYLKISPGVSPLFCNGTIVLSAVIKLTAAIFQEEKSSPHRGPTKNSPINWRLKTRISKTKKEQNGYKFGFW
jgi:hypothetical protein